MAYVVVGGLSKGELSVLSESNIAAIPQTAIPHIPPTQFNVSIYTILEFIIITFSLEVTY